MLRKLVKQGRDALTLTVPAKWVKERNLKVGDEVSISIDRSNLIVSSDLKHVPKKIGFSIDKSKKEFIRTLISGAYRRGFDEISVSFDNPDDAIKIQDACTSLIGCNVVDHSKNIIIIKVMAGENDEEFPKQLNKMFQTLKFLSSSLKEHLGGVKKKEEELSLIRKQLIKLRDHCQRTLNVTGFGGDKRVEYNTLIFLIEKVGAEYFRLFECILNNKISVTKKTNELISDQIYFFDMLSSAFMKGDFLAVGNLHLESRKDYDDDHSKNTYFKMVTNKGYNPEIVFFCNRIMNYLFALSARMEIILI
jgi:phosphate uptake regulator